MRSVLLSILLRTALFVALVASAALFADYQQEAGPGFCGVVSGCAEVRASAYSKLWGIPLPTVGLGVFLGLFALAAWASTKRHIRWVAVLCAVAALGAIALIAIMVFVLEAVCQWCMAVDVGAIVAAGCAVAQWRSAPALEPVGQRVLWTGAGLAAVVVTLLWGQGPRHEPPPPDVAALQVPGRVTVVAFSDFQCPFCRLMHPVVRRMAEQHPSELAVRLVVVPGTGHAGADVMARGYLCADPRQRAAVATALFELEVDPLVYGAVKHAAEQAGVDVETYAQRLSRESEQRTFGKLLYRIIEQEVVRTVERAGGDAATVATCMNAPETQAELERNVAMFQRAKLVGLPAYFVGNFLVEGADEPLFRAAVEAALAGGKGRDVKWMFTVLGALLLAVASVSIWRHRHSVAARS